MGAPYQGNRIMKTSEQMVELLYDRQRKMASTIRARRSDLVRQATNQKQRLSQKLEDHKEHLSQKLENHKELLSQKLENHKELLSKRLRQATNHKKQLSQKLENHKELLSEKLENHKELLSQKLENHKELLSKRLEKQLNKARSAKARQSRDMCVFVVSLADLFVTAFWLGHSPQTFHLYFTFQSTLVMSIRVVKYRLNRWHYFFFDFCYAANAAVLAFVWLAPQSPWFLHAVTGMSGVLLLSVYLLRNSFVPHCLDLMMSYQIHVSPALALWALRWYGGEGGFAVVSETSVWPCLCLYLTWAVAYFIFMFFVTWHRCERKGNATLYKLMAIEKGLLWRFPSRFQNHRYGPVLFMLIHFSLFASGLSLVYSPFYVHSLSIIFTLMWAFRNGANYYVTYFWKVYEDQIHEFERLSAEQSALQHAEPAPEPTA